MMIFVVIGILTIVHLIVSSSGENHTCSSLRTPPTETLRFCESAMLENQSLVYLDFTSYHENITGFCSCSLFTRPDTRVNFIAHGSSSKPGLRCGVNIRVETGEISKYFGCFSTNLSQEIVTSEMRITIYREAFSYKVTADYACYSVFSENNSTMSIKCENEAVLTTSTPSAPSTPSTSSTAIPSRTVVHVRGQLSTQFLDVLIPIVVGAFILACAGTVLIIHHYRCQKNVNQENNHENPLNNVNVVHQEHSDGVSLVVLHLQN